MATLRAISIICGVVLGFACCVRYGASAPVSKARQFLAPLPGYVPVYIRPGDTPLEEINLDLAEAFSSYARKHARLSFGRSQNDLAVEVEKEKKAAAKDEDISVVGLEEEQALESATSAAAPERIPEQQTPASQHIQKIPKTL